MRRIVAMKLRNEVTPAGEAKPLPELSTIGGAEHRAVEDKITRQSITLLRNQGAALPLRSPSQRIFILTPWGEQAEAMRRRFDEKGYRQVSGAKLSATPWEAQKQAIDQADVVIIGTLATGVSPVERNGDPNAPALAPRLKRSLPIEAASAPMSGNGSLVFNVAEDLPAVLANPFRPQPVRAAAQRGATNAQCDGIRQTARQEADPRDPARALRRDQLRRSGRRHAGHLLLLRL
ncbi:hypothetical protein JOS77_05815 [Chromobacterium haemolyticum]|nr:hypothetical protein JOS77_05815 [Chromobacterium haemolyticum]